MIIFKKGNKELIEFFIRNFTGKFGFFFKITDSNLRIKTSFRINRFKKGLRIENPKNLELGSNSYCGINFKKYASEFWEVKIVFYASINSNVMIYLRSKVTISIGDNVLIGSNVVLKSSNHCFHKKKIPVNDHDMTKGDNIKNDAVSKGTNAVILPNYEIGKGVIVAPRTLVTSDVESYTVVGGVPATLLKKR